MTSWLMRSDLASGLVGAVFKYSFSSFAGSMSMVAAQAVVISILARVIPGKLSVNVGSLTESQKSEILVAVLGAAVAAYKKHDPLQGAVGYSAIDSLALQLMAILQMSEGAIV